MRGVLEIIVIFPQMGGKHSIWERKLCAHLQYVVLYVDSDFNVASSIISLLMS